MVYTVTASICFQLLVVYGIYNICWVPYFIYGIFIAGNGDGKVEIYSFTVNLLVINSSVNCFIYLYFNKTFRQEVIRLLSCGKYKGRNKVNTSVPDAKSTAC